MAFCMLDLIRTRVCQSLSLYELAVRQLEKAGDIDPVTVKIANCLLIRQPEL